MGRSRDQDPGGPADLRVEWRRLGRAALFFAACVLGFGALAVLGLFH